MLTSINAYYQNVRGLKTKLINIKNNISICEYDIIFLTETWLNDSVSDGELCDPNKYCVYRRDRANVNCTQVAEFLY